MICVQADIKVSSKQAYNCIKDEQTMFFLKSMLPSNNHFVF